MDKTIKGFSDIQISASTDQIQIQQDDIAQTNTISFPPDRADALIAAIKAVKREIAAKPETPAA